MAHDSTYEVEWSGRTMRTIRQLGEAMNRVDRKQLAQEIQQIHELLSDDPVSLGYIYDAHGDILEVLGGYGKLAIDFSIDKRRKWVYVRDCRRLSFDINQGH